MKTAIQRCVRPTAFALAILTVAAAVHGTRRTVDVSHATPLLVDLTRGLIRHQRADGSFDPYPEDREMPEVLRTVPHALATAALARAHALGVGAHVPDLGARLEAALDVLVDRQQPGGFFGQMPAGRPDTDRWPSVEATAAGALALSLAARPADAGSLTAALLALERTVQVGLRDGWTRALVAITLEAAAARGANSLLGRDPRQGFAVREEGLLPGPQDDSVAEAMVRLVLGAPGPYPLLVAEAVRQRPPVYDGERSNLQSWWMQAWLEVRAAGDPTAFFEALRTALAAALEAPPKGSVRESWYADEVTEGASGVLALAEGLDPVGAPPFPALESVRSALEAE